MMTNTKKIAAGGLLAGLAAMFQLAPFLFSELFALFTLLSAMPIYIISRLSPRIGLGAAFITCVLTTVLSPHEGLLFLFTNGPVGLSLGICCYYKTRDTTNILITSLILTITLCIMNFIIGIPVFGMQIPVALPIQAAVITGFSAVYSFIFLYFAKSVYNLLESKTGLF